MVAATCSSHFWIDLFGESVFCKCQKVNSCDERTKFIKIETHSRVAYFLHRRLFSICSQRVWYSVIETQSSTRDSFCGRNVLWRASSCLRVRWDSVFNEFHWRESTFERHRRASAKPWVMNRKFNQRLMVCGFAMEDKLNDSSKTSVGEWIFEAIERSARVTCSLQWNETKCFGIECFCLCCN